MPRSQHKMRKIKRNTGVYESINQGQTALNKAVKNLVIDKATEKKLLVLIIEYDDPWLRAYNMKYITKKEYKKLKRIQIRIDKTIDLVFALRLGSKDLRLLRNGVLSMKQ